jgi:hypothetical protein
MPSGIQFCDGDGDGDGDGVSDGDGAHDSSKSASTLIDSEDLSQICIN